MTLVSGMEPLVKLYARSETGSAKSKVNDELKGPSMVD